MKQTFRITIINKTDRELDILPLDRRISPLASEILELPFSQMLRLNLLQDDDGDSTPYTIAITSPYRYYLKYKNREHILQWKIKVRKLQNQPGSPSSEDLMMVCSVQSSDGPVKTVTHGPDDD